VLSARIIIGIFSLLVSSHAAYAQTITGGAYHSLFRCSDNTAITIGNNDYGQLGDGTSQNASTPVQVDGLTGLIAISGGADHSLFLEQNNTAWATGENSYGQLGDGTTVDSETPVQVSGLTQIERIASGDYFSLFLKQDGTVWACGSNDSGQLGDGSTSNSSTPIEVVGLCPLQSRIHENSFSEMGFILYPNPSKGIIILDMSNAKGQALTQMKVMSALGSIVYQTTLYKRQEMIAISLPAGIYFLHLSTDEEIGLKKLAIE